MVWHVGLNEQQLTKIHKTNLEQEWSALCQLCGALLEAVEVVPGEDAEPLLPPREQLLPLHPHDAPQEGGLPRTTLGQHPPSPGGQDGLVHLGHHPAAAEAVEAEFGAGTVAGNISTSARSLRPATNDGN